jgi:SMC interacting uncharacterized protein involved in chromosome segregation
MKEWLERLRQTISNIRERLRRRARVRRILRQMAQRRRRITRDQEILQEKYEQLKKAKGPPPNPQLIRDLEMDIQLMEGTLETRMTELKNLQSELDELDPDGSIRTSQ